MCLALHHGTPGLQIYTFISISSSGQGQAEVQLPRSFVGMQAALLGRNGSSYQGGGGYDPGPIHHPPWEHLRARAPARLGQSARAHLRGCAPACRPRAFAAMAVEKKENREDSRVAPRISGAWRFIVSRCW